MENLTFPMHVGVVVMSEAQLRDVYAVLAGNAPPTAKASAPSPSPTPSPSDGGASTSGPATSEPPASPKPSGDVELDAHGHPWNEELHASTKSQTKEGLWRMKPGVSRPDPAPGYPVEDAESEEPEEKANDAETEEVEDDEFAAFREAAADSEGDEEPEPEPRKWTEADISKLCNQAAVKLGDPGPIKNIIARYVPEGETPHSRNIPEDRREDFAREVEQKADIEFAG